MSYSPPIGRVDLSLGEIEGWFISDRRPLILGEDGAPREMSDAEQLPLGEAALLDVGTTDGTVASGSHTHQASAISDSTTAGRALLIAADAAAQRTTLGLGDLATQNASAAILDPLRRAVENASGGLNTVLYNAGGDPCYVRVLPAFDYASLGTTYTTGMNGTGTLEAFLVNGVQKPWIGIGLYQAANIGGRVVSQPGLDPWHTINYDEALAVCAAMGGGWRLMSVWDWAAITHLCMARGYQPKGNTDHGRAHDARYQVARRADGGLPGVTTGTPRTLTGSGPNEWNHDGSIAGIADLVGNVWELVCGMKVVGGVVRLAADNGTATAEASWANTGFTVPASATWSGISNVGAPDALKRALIVPATGVTSPQGHLYTTLTGECFPIRGGLWDVADHAGLAALALNVARSTRSIRIGFRPVFTP